MGVGVISGIDADARMNDGVVLDFEISEERAGSDVIFGGVGTDSQPPKMSA